MPLEVWGTVFVPTDADGMVLAPEDLPLAVALAERRPTHGRISITAMDGRRHQLAVTAFPLVGQNERELGAVALFWEDAVVIVRFWGTRGSVPTPGPATQRFGGNTSCVEVRADDRDSIVVLDAGTGIRALGATLPPDARRVDILLSHLHMDHIIGLGFFAGLFRPGLEVHIWGPSSTVLPLRARLTRYLSPPLFPVRLRDLPCRLTLHDVPLGTFEVPGNVGDGCARVSSRPDRRLPPRRRNVDARLPQRSRAGARRPTVPRPAALDIRLRPGVRRRRPDP